MLVITTCNRESEFDRCAMNIISVYPNLPTMIFDNAFTYNQPKSSTSVFSCQSCVYLIKRFEKIVHVASKGYDAGIIKQLPELLSMSNSQKVRMWTISCRFCIMIEREPSGHINESSPEIIK